MGHLVGFISGYSEFDRHIQTLNGSSLFITPDGISAAIVGDYLDPKLYHYELLNPVLTPKIRKLPSALDAQLLAAIASSNNENQNQENAALNAPLTSTPLLAQILNGTFDQVNPTNPNYGWSTRGDSEIINGQAILGESDRAYC
jgi:large repetitive protein